MSCDCDRKVRDHIKSLKYTSDAKDVRSNLHCQNNCSVVLVLTNRIEIVTI